MNQIIVADFSAQAVVNTYLRQHFPTDPIVGEEDSKDLRGEAGKALREKVHELTNGVFSSSEQLTEEKVLKPHIFNRQMAINLIAF